MIDKPQSEPETQKLLMLAGTRVIYDKLGLTGVETSRQGMRGEITEVRMSTYPACFVVKWEDGSYQDYSFASLHSKKRWPYAALKPHIRSYILLQSEYPVEYQMGVIKSDCISSTNPHGFTIKWILICSESGTVLAEHATQKEAEADAEEFANENPGDRIEVAGVVSTWTTGKAHRYPPDPQST